MKAGTLLRRSQLPLAAHDAPAPPRGYGNVASLDSATVASFADETVRYLHCLESHFSVSIRHLETGGLMKPTESAGMSALNAARRLNIDLNRLYVLLRLGRIKGRKVNGKWEVCSRTVEERIRRQ